MAPFRLLEKRQIAPLNCAPKTICLVREFLWQELEKPWLTAAYLLRLCAMWRSRSRSSPPRERTDPQAQQSAPFLRFLPIRPPRLLVCLRSDSRIGLAVGRNRVFCVNVLPEGASALAGHFAGRFDAEEPNRCWRHRLPALPQRASSKRRHRLRMHRRSNHFPWKP